MFAFIIKSLVADPEVNRGGIVEMFQDSSESPLSLNNICKIGKLFSCQPGQYWRPLSAIVSLGMLACGSIYDADENVDISSYGQNQKSQKPGNNFLEMILFKSSIIDFRFLQNRLSEMSTSSSGDAKNDSAMLVTIVAMFGNHRIDNYNLYALKMLLGHSTSMGIIGGVQNQAYYIIGEFEGNLLILDPHKVNVSLNSLTFRNLKKWVFPKIWISHPLALIKTPTLCTTQNLTPACI